MRKADYILIALILIMGYVNYTMLKDIINRNKV